LISLKKDTLVQLGVLRLRFLGRYFAWNV
jgi:hypothetical protein